VVTPITLVRIPEHRGLASSVARAARLPVIALAPLLALALTLAVPPALRAQDATQRLLDIKRQQEQGIAPAQPGMQPAQPGAAAPGAPGAPSAQGGEDAVVVDAKGVASFYAADPARSRDEALEAAQRDAVEQASGIIIQSESQLRNFDLVSDEVLSQSKGFIRTYEITRQGQDGPMYNVFIRATVVKKAFVQNFEDALDNLYRRVGKPRIMLVVQEFEMANGPDGQTMQSDSALNVVEKEIRKILLKQGFTFIDPRSLPRTARKGSDDDAQRDALLKAARSSKAELVMLGRGRVASGGMLQKFNIVEASVGLDVIRTDNGQVMASDVATGKGLHINADTAAVTALQKAADEITPKIMEQVTYQWIKERNEGQRIEMVVRGVSFGDLLTLRRALGNTVKGVRKVRQKSFSDGEALLELESKDPTDRLAESLFDTEFDGFKLTIVDVSATTLTVKMVKAKPQ
jgi:hypothetical protein